MPAERCLICDRDLPTESNLPSPLHVILCECPACIHVCRSYRGALCLQAAPENWSRRAFAAEALLNALLRVAHDRDNLGPTFEFVRTAQTMLTTTDAHERNQAALKIGEYEGAVAAHMLLAVYVDPRTRGCRGTLVYALQNSIEFLPPFVTELVESVLTGSYEEAVGALQLLEKIGDFEMEPKEHAKLVERLRERVAGDDPDRAKIAKDCIAAISEGE
jgi:hypothetical protein